MNKLDDPTSTEIPIDRAGARRRRRQGTSMVEAALVLPLILMVLMGTLEFGLVFARYQILVGSAREGARIAALARTNCRAGQVKGEIDRFIMNNSNQLGMVVLPTNVRVSTLCPAQGTPIELTLTYDHYMTLIGGLLPSGTKLPLSVTVTVLKE